MWNVSKIFLQLYQIRKILKTSLNKLKTGWLPLLPTQMPLPLRADCVQSFGKEENSPRHGEKKGKTNEFKQTIKTES